VKRRGSPLCTRDRTSPAGPDRSEKCQKQTLSLAFERGRQLGRLTTVERLGKHGDRLGVQVAPFLCRLTSSDARRLSKPTLRLSSFLRHNRNSY
jgi:hypothetical protein